MIPERIKVVPAINCTGAFLIIGPVFKDGLFERVIIATYQTGFRLEQSDHLSTSPRPKIPIQISFWPLDRPENPHVYLKVKGDTD
jgi:hypothetical protein